MDFSMNFFGLRSGSDFDAKNKVNAFAPKNNAAIAFGIAVFAAVLCFALKNKYPGIESLIYVSLCCGFLFGIFAAIKQFGYANRIANIARSKIRSAAQDYVFLQGRIKPLPDITILSPLASRKCVWYHYQIYRHESRGKSSSYVLIEDDSSTESFILKGLTGVCTIHPEDANVVAKTVVWGGFSRTPSSGPSKNAFVRLFYNIFGRYRYHETILCPHQKLYAYGMFKTVNNEHTLSNADLPDNALFILSEKAPEKIAGSLRLIGIFMVLGAIASLFAMFIV